MQLPALPIPTVELPFEIPFLLHPVVDHFVIALPIVVLLLEVINLVFKKRAIGLVSFFLLLLTVVVSVGAYLTGSVDGKEIFALLNETAQSELKAHKLLGTYLMLASAVVLLFKLLSSVIARKLMKALYLFILILFVAGILNQGREGGELVYTYGVNVKQVAQLQEQLSDLQEEMEELEEADKGEVTQVTPEPNAPSVEVVTPTATPIAEKVEVAKVVEQTIIQSIDLNHSTPELNHSTPSVVETTVID